jgi:hypothetical protein
MVRAALAGAVDFTGVSATDVQWWRRCNIILDELSRLEDGDLLAEAYRYHLALMANSALTDDSFNRAKKSALETFTEIFNLAHPWETTSTRKMRVQQMGRLIEAYEKIFGGRPSDPEFRRRVEADVVKDQAKRGQALRRVSPDDILRQRLLEDGRRRRKGNLARR